MPGIEGSWSTRCSTACSRVSMGRGRVRSAGESCGTTTAPATRSNLRSLLQRAPHASLLLFTAPCPDVAWAFLDMGPRAARSVFLQTALRSQIGWEGEVTTRSARPTRLRRHSLENAWCIAANGLCDSHRREVHRVSQTRTAKRLVLRTHATKGCGNCLSADSAVERQRQCGSVDASPERIYCTAS